MPNIMNCLLKRLRQQKCGSETLTAVAEKLGARPPYLLKLENGGIKTPTKETLEKLKLLYGLVDTKKRKADDSERKTAELIDRAYAMLEAGQLPDGPSVLLDKGKFFLTVAKAAAKFVYSRTVPLGLSLYEGQEAVVLPAALRHCVRSNRHERLIELLLTQPQRVFIAERKTMPRLVASRFTTNTTLVVDLVIQTDCYLGCAVSASEERVAAFHSAFKGLRECALPAAEAVEHIRRLSGRGGARRKNLQ